MNDLNSTTYDYVSLAGATANGGNGWNPIGGTDDPFTGTFDGQGYEIRDMVINRPARDRTGLFGAVEWGNIRNLGVVNATVAGQDYVGGLVGWISNGDVSNCYVSGNITGWYGPSEDYSDAVGGLVGANLQTDEYNAIGRGNVSDCHATGNVTGMERVGGLVGWNAGPVTNSYSSSNVTGGDYVGGLVGYNWGVDVSNSYFTGNVTGCCVVGGLVGYSRWAARMINSHYDYDEVLIDGQNAITIGALSAEDFQEWLANDKSLDVNERLSQEGGYYVINNISDFKQLLPFGQNGLKFRLKNDLDLTSEPDFYIPYLAGEFDGDGHNISNLNVNLYFAFGVGLFGYLACDGNVRDVGAENVNITGDWTVGGLVGYNDGTVSNSHSTGSVFGHESEVGGLVGCSMWRVINSYSSSNVSGMFYVGGLVGYDFGYVSSSYSTGNVAGDQYVGGLVGENYGTLSNSYSTGNVTGNYDVGGLVGQNFYAAVSNCYATGNATGSGSVGGLVGYNSGGTVTDSFWDTETSGHNTSAGGTGKNTTEMKDFDTFSGAAWNITAVGGPGERNIAYIWNIVDDLTYPFLSWQPLS
jgi:hypothetical protein